VEKRLNPKESFWKEPETKREQGEGKGRLKPQLNNRSLPERAVVSKGRRKNGNRTGYAVMKIKYPRSGEQTENTKGDSNKIK